MSRSVKSTLIVCLSMLLWAGVAPAQDEGVQAGGVPAGKGSHGTQNADRQKVHREMRAEIEAGNARLEELTAAMNAAEGDAKIDAIAAVVNEFVAQRRAAQARMGQMRGMHGGGKGKGKGGGKGHGNGKGKAARDADDGDEPAS